MRTSEQIHELATALALAQSEIKAASKDRENPFFNSRYSTLDAIWEACRGPLTSHGLSVIQGAGAEGEAITVTTMLLHTSGQWITSVLPLMPKDSSPQAAGSALTYARRYGLAAMVGVTSDEDDDGNQAQPDRPRARRSGPQAQTKAPAEIGQPGPAGESEEHRQESERLFDAAAPAIPPRNELVTAFQAGRKECPACHEPYIIRGKPEYGGGWVCWAKGKKGCGWKITDKLAPVEAAAPAAPVAAPVEDDREFLEKAILRKANEHKLTKAEGEALEASYLKGKKLKDAPASDLNKLYLFLMDLESVRQFRVEFQLQ